MENGLTCGGHLPVKNVHPDQRTYVLQDIGDGDDDGKQQNGDGKLQIQASFVKNKENNDQCSKRAKSSGSLPGYMMALERYVIIKISISIRNLLSQRRGMNCLTMKKQCSVRQGYYPVHGEFYSVWHVIFS